MEVFSRPRTKATLAPPSKKRKFASAIEEITFDTSAREDYLTGFHKRKLQRIKHAKEEATRREREEKLTARKILREERKLDLEKHVQAVNSVLREHNGTVSEYSENEAQLQAEQWDGIEKNPVVDREDEYVDEDRFTTVTVEAVNVSKDGLHKSSIEDEQSQSPDTEKHNGEQDTDLVTKERIRSQQGKRVWTKEPPSRPKKKKKKFRYESKAERKVSRFKERSGNKEKAKARKR